MHLRADAFDGTAVGPLNKPLSDASQPATRQPASQPAGRQPASPQPASQPPATQPDNHIVNIFKSHQTYWNFENSEGTFDFVVEIH